MPRSVAMWVKPTVANSTSALFNLDGGSHKVTFNSSGTLSVTGFTTTYVNGIAGATTITFNRWNYLEFTTSSQFNTTVFSVGTDGTNYTGGFIDEFRIFDTTRTAPQVKADYVARGDISGVGEQVSNLPNNNTALNNDLGGYWKLDDITTVHTPTIVQPTGANCTCYSVPAGSTGQSTPVTATYQAAQQVGDLNVVIIGWFSTTGTVTQVQDTNGNTYQVATALSTGNGFSQAIYYAKNISAAPANSNTVTVTLSADQSDPDLRILEYNNVDTSSLWMVQVTRVQEIVQVQLTAAALALVMPMIY
jgi:hypothetical protein